jgi:hypothetical protein
LVRARRVASSATSCKNLGPLIDVPTPYVDLISVGKDLRPVGRWP